MDSSDTPNGGNTLITAVEPGGVTAPVYIALRKISATHTLEAIRGAGKLVLATDRMEDEVETIDLHGSESLHLRPHDMYFVHNDSKHNLYFRQIGRPALRAIHQVPLLTPKARESQPLKLEKEPLIETVGMRRFGLPLPPDFVSAFNEAAAKRA